MSPTLNLRVSKNVRSVATPTVPRGAIRIDPDEVESPNEHVAEVVASQGSTVLDVQHVGQVRGRRRQAAGWLALGGLMLVAGAGVMASEVSQDWSGYQVAHAEATATGRPLPAAPGHGLGGLAVGLALLGLVPLGFGLVLRNETGLDGYTLGETPDATFPVCTDSLPVDRNQAFPLVGRSGARFTLSFTDAMQGRVHWSGRTLDLRSLVEQGHTVRTGAGHSMVLPDGARCRIDHEGITYQVSTVARGKSTARRSDTDKPFWIYNAGSFAVLGTLLAMMHLVPEDAMAMDLDELAAENHYVGYMQQPDKVEDQAIPEEVPDEPESGDADGGTKASPADRSPKGATSAHPSKSPSRMVAVKGPRRSLPLMTRTPGPPSARTAGILGAIPESSGRFLSSPSAGAFVVGNADRDIWSSVAGTEPGGTIGVRGLDVEGTGRQGGHNAEGTIGFEVGLLGKQSWGDRKGSSAVGHSKRRPKTPRVRRGGKDQITGSIDKDAIRRVVRSRINEIRHCYNQGLVRDPNLQGRVAVRFSIGPVGTVLSSAVVNNSLGDAKVGSCVAKTVRRWKFPRPASGGSAMVTYPFAFVPG